MTCCMQTAVQHCMAGDKGCKEQLLELMLCGVVSSRMLAAVHLSTCYQGRSRSCHPETRLVADCCDPCFLLQVVWHMHMLELETHGQPQHGWLRGCIKVKSQSTADTLHTRSQIQVCNNPLDFHLLQITHHMCMYLRLGNLHKCVCRPKTAWGKRTQSD